MISGTHLKIPFSAATSISRATKSLPLINVTSVTFPRVMNFSLRKQKLSPRKWIIK
jgi:hypothetical protein